MSTSRSVPVRNWRLGQAGSATIWSRASYERVYEAAATESDSDDAVPGTGTG